MTESLCVDEALYYRLAESRGQVTSSCVKEWA